MNSIYELLAHRQAELEEREKELLILVKELEGVQQELADIKAMSNIRLLQPADPVPETNIDTDDVIADLVELKGQLKQDMPAYFK